MGVHKYVVLFLSCQVGPLGAAPWVSRNSTTSPLWVKEEASLRRRKSQSLGLQDGSSMVPRLSSPLRGGMPGLQRGGFQSCEGSSMDLPSQKTSQSMVCLLAVNRGHLGAMGCHNPSAP